MSGGHVRECRTFRPRRYRTLFPWDQRSVIPCLPGVLFTGIFFFNNGTRFNSPILKRHLAHVSKKAKKAFLSVENYSRKILQIEK